MKNIAPRKVGKLSMKDTSHGEVLTLDVETTTFQKGNPFSRRNKLCTVGILNSVGYSDFDIEYSNGPYGGKLKTIQEMVGASDLIIGFNLKFDIHWLRRYIDDLVLPDVWDCQLAEFILSHQSNTYPSLDKSLDRVGLAPKLDVVRVEYWDRGIDTPEIPWDILAEYQKQDVVQTSELYKKQKETFEAGDPRLYEMFKLQCKDLLILEDMEFQGMLLDTQLANQKAEELESRINSIMAEIGKLADERINWGSSDHVSVYLYGGTIPFKVRVATERVLKSGETKFGEKWGISNVDFPRLVSPLERSESAATSGMSDEDISTRNKQLEGAGRRPIQRIYSVDEATLRGLKAKGRTKRIIELLLDRAECSKLLSTYYKGIPDLVKEMDWPEGEIHGQFNQCVAITSRLSSSKPNLQNLAGITKPLYISRYR